jgi:hypothetical protein
MLLCRQVRFCCQLSCQSRHLSAQKSPQYPNDPAVTDFVGNDSRGSAELKGAAKLFFKSISRAGLHSLGLCLFCKTETNDVLALSRNTGFLLKYLASLGEEETAVGKLGLVVAGCMYGLHLRLF